MAHVRAVGFNQVLPFARRVGPTLSDFRPLLKHWRMIMGHIGTGELIIALLVVVMLFGARRLPEVARGLGQSLKIFKTEISRPNSDAVTRETGPSTSSRTEPRGR